MKRLAWFVLALAALTVLSRLPHPATDVGELEPVRVVWIGEAGIRTDTGATGRGADLTTAVEELHDSASGVIFLETAEYVILEPGYRVGPELYEIFRPSCKVCVGSGADLVAAAAYLSVHPPDMTLSRLRAGEWGLQTLTITEEGGSLE